MSRRKLVLAVVDGCKPAMLEEAMRTGRAPAISAVVARGTYVASGAVAAFPSVTPVCAASIGTGRLQDGHHIPGMNWYRRSERRYVEYGSSFAASWRFGLLRQLTDTVFNLNMAHLAPAVETVFETLDDAGLRTAGTTYLIYRGRHRHEVARDIALARVASALWRRHAMGPRELFYADVFTSRETGCRSQMGMPGLRDQHAGCVGEHLVAHDLFDFLLLSLPDNDAHSHKHGPDAQVESIAAADRQIDRMMAAAGGRERFLDEHAVIVVADHSHAFVEHTMKLADIFADWRILPPSGRRPDAEIAVCPNQRSAMVYGLGEPAPAGTGRRRGDAGRIAAAALEAEGVDLAMWREGEQAVVASRTGVLRFAPGGDLRDRRGGRWTIGGDLAVLGATIEHGAVGTDDYPDAWARVWAALTCPASGDVLLSARPGWEFADWGGAAHPGGGSHGSLHRSDSIGALAFAGLHRPPDHDEWSIADVTPAIRAHFGVA